MKKLVLIAILATALALIAGCAAPAPTVAPATSAPAPTNPPAPTSAPAATNAPAPTNAPAATQPPAPTTAPAPTEAPTTAAQPAGVKVLRIGHGTYPDVMDPQKSSYGIEIEVLKLTYEGLLAIDNKGNIGPGGADKWQASADGTSMSFHIRDGLVRSDGTPITCEDYKYALDREVDPLVPGKQYTSILYDIKGAKELDALAADDPSKIDKNQVADLFKNYGVECTDASNLKVTFANPVGFWNYIAYTWVTYPTDKRQVDADPDNWWTKPEGHVGNGPFKIQSMDQGKSIVFVPNDKYWRGKPKLDRIEFVYNTDNAVIYEAYKKDELDMDSYIDPQQIPDITADATLKDQFVRYPAAITTAMANNDSKKPFDDKNVRVAFSQALDRAGYVRDVNKGVGIPYTRWIPPGVPGSQDTKGGVPDTDAKAAIQTLVTNGYAATTSTADKPKVDCAKLGDIKLTYAASPLNNARFQFLAGNYINVFGCPITLDPVDATVYTALTKDVKTNPQISRQGWIQDYPHPQDWLSLYWECGGFSARWGYCNKDLDKALGEADQTLDFETAIKKYQDAENILMGDVPGAFAYVSENTHLIKPWVIGPKDYPSSSDAEWAGEWGPVWTYDIDLTKVPSTYPTQ